MKLVFTNSGTQPQTFLEKGPFDQVYIQDCVIFGVKSVVPPGKPTSKNSPPPSVDTQNVVKVGSHTNGTFEVDNQIYNRMTVENV